MPRMIMTGGERAGAGAHARTLQPGIRDDGIRKVLAGVTSLEEVLRVTRDD
jgi:general secretion pathway protein E